MFCNSYILVHFVFSSALLSLECHGFDHLVPIPMVGLISCSIASTFLARPSHPHPIFGYGIKLTARGGGDALTKVGTDVRRVQNLGRAKLPPKNLMPRQKSAQKPNDRASFHEL